MPSTRSRIAAGVLLALALGTFGPISRAVSMESRRLVDVTVPLGGAPWVPGARAGRGATAGGEHATETSHIGWSLRVEESFIVRPPLEPHETQVTVDEFPTVELIVRPCPYLECPEEARYTGLGELTTGPATWRFTGVLRTSDGRTCDVDATWRLDAPVGPSGVGAPGSADLSCAGLFAWEQRHGRVYTIAEERWS